MSIKNPISGLFLYFIGVLLIAGGIVRVRFYATTTMDTVISFAAIFVGAGLIIYSDVKRRR